MSTQTGCSHFALGHFVHGGALVRGAVTTAPIGMGDELCRVPVQDIISSYSVGNSSIGTCRVPGPLMAPGHERERAAIATFLLRESLRERSKWMCAAHSPPKRPHTARAPRARSARGQRPLARRADHTFTARSSAISASSAQCLARGPQVTLACARSRRTRALLPAARAGWPTGRTARTSRRCSSTAPPRSAMACRASPPRALGRGSSSTTPSSSLPNSILSCARARGISCVPRPNPPRAPAMPPVRHAPRVTRHAFTPQPMYDDDRSAVFMVPKLDMLNHGQVAAAREPTTIRARRLRCDHLARTPPCRRRASSPRSPAPSSSRSASASNSTSLRTPSSRPRPRLSARAASCCSTTDATAASARSTCTASPPTTANRAEGRSRDGPRSGAPPPVCVGPIRATSGSDAHPVGSRLAASPHAGSAGVIRRLQHPDR